MDVHVKLDGNGYIPDAYAKYADRSGLYAGTPTRSFPFEVTGVPEGTATLAVVFYDIDSRVRLSLDSLVRLRHPRERHQIP